jgi:hypothetical protein
MVIGFQMPILIKNMLYLSLLEKQLKTIIILKINLICQEALMLKKHHRLLI